MCLWDSLLSFKSITISINTYYIMKSEQCHTVYAKDTLYRPFTVLWEKHCITTTAQPNRLIRSREVLLMGKLNFLPSHSLWLIRQSSQMIIFHNVPSACGYFFRLASHKNQRLFSAHINCVLWIVGSMDTQTDGKR